MYEQRVTYLLNLGNSIIRAIDVKRHVPADDAPRAFRCLVPVELSSAVLVDQPCVTPPPEEQRVLKLVVN